MKEKVVKAKSDKTREVQCTIQYPETLAEAVGLDGESNVFNLYCGMRDIRVQNAMRRLTLAGKSDKEIQDFVSTMKIDAKISVQRDAVASTVADLKKLSGDERKAKIAELMKQLAAMSKESA